MDIAIPLPCPRCGTNNSENYVSGCADLCLEFHEAVAAMGKENVDEADFHTVHLACDECGHQFEVAA